MEIDSCIPRSFSIADVGRPNGSEVAEGCKVATDCTKNSRELIGRIARKESHVERCMTSLQAHLDQGYAILLDSRGNPVAEWHDRKYAHAIQRGECSVHRWHRIFREFALREGYLIQTEGGFIASTRKT